MKRTFEPPDSSAPDTKENDPSPARKVVGWVVVTGVTVVLHYLLFDKGVVQALIYGALTSSLIAAVSYYETRKKGGKRP